MQVTRGRVASYRQLAVVVPGIALVCIAGGIGAMVNGYAAGGLGAILIGLLIVGFIVWFLRLPIGDGGAQRWHRLATGRVTAALAFA